MSEIICYKGKPITELTREELIEALKHVFKELEKSRGNFNDYLDMEARFKAAKAGRRW